MSSQLLKDLMKQSKSLTPPEQMDLLIHLAERVRHSQKPARSFRDIRGAAPYPLMGEDAQQWVSRTRRESDEHRERALRGEVVVNEN
ncbi:MAG: hypothetical protein DRR08_13390 [Candidatus Parabeggiatoa sp. nov. 2]|nr:MAG: hypothetical protein DRR08_13390 [Gammaproteobacteria bacterium]HEC85553.1 hypothetical protein [Thioploca sp.]